MIDKLEAVQEAIADGQMELARNLLRILIEDYADNADVWYYAAQVAVNDKQREVFLEKAVDLDPLHHQAANELHALKTGERPHPMIQADETGGKQADLSKRPQYIKFWRRAIVTILNFILFTALLFLIMDFLRWILR